MKNTSVVLRKALVLGAWLGLAAPAFCSAESPAVVDGYTQISSYTPPDYSSVPRNLVKAPMLVSTNARYALMVLGLDLKNTAILIWDESQGTGKGFDTMYVDVNLNGDLSEPAEKFFWANGDPKKIPQEKYVIPPIVLPGGDRFGLGLHTHGEPDTISYPTGYGWTDAKGRNVLGLGHLPHNSSLQWGKSIQDAPVHVLGSEHIPIPYVNPKYPEGIEPPPNPFMILPGLPVGKTRAGTAIRLSWRMASPGSRPPHTELRGSAGGGQVYLRVLKDSKIIRELPFQCGCACAAGFVTKLTVPADIPPGRHQVVFRIVRSPEQGGPADFLFPIEIANETYGQPVPSPVADAIAGQLAAKTRLVSLRRAGEPEQLTARSAREQALAATVSDTWFDCFNAHGDGYRLDQCRGAEPLLVLGPRERAEDSNRGLLRFDITGLPADAKVKAAWLQLSVQAHKAGADTKLAAYALRRAWDEVPGTNGTYACQVGPRHKKDGGEKWGKPGAQDTATDRQPEPVSVASLVTLAAKASAPASNAPPAGCAEGFCKLPAAGEGRQAQPVIGLDVTAVVRQWLAAPAENHGLLLALEGRGTLTLYASEYDNTALRPTLYVAYEGGEAKSVLTVPVGEDLAAARKSAAEAGKPLLLVFGSPTCKYCDQFKKTVLPHQDVAAVLKEKVVCQALDVANWPGLVEKLGIASMPTVVIVNPADLKVLGRMTGRDLMEVKPFLAFLAKAAE
jgi:hypothetical protein